MRYCEPTVKIHHIKMTSEQPFYYKKKFKVIKIGRNIKETCNIINCFKLNMNVQPQNAYYLPRCCKSSSPLPQCGESCNQQEMYHMMQHYHTCLAIRISNHKCQTTHTCTLKHVHALTTECITSNHHYAPFVLKL